MINGFSGKSLSTNLTLTCYFKFCCWHNLRFTYILHSQYRCFYKCRYNYVTKLLQKREMRKDIVIELSYKGFSRASDYS